MVQPHPTVSRGVGERPTVSDCVYARQGTGCFGTASSRTTESVAYNVNPASETGRKYGPSNWSYRSSRPAVLTGQFDTSGRTKGLKRCPSTTGMQGRSTTSRALIGAMFPFTVVPACYLPVYASQRPLPGPRKDSVRDCSLGFVAAAISDG